MEYPDRLLPNSNSKIETEFEKDSKFGRWIKTNFDEVKPNLGDFVRLPIDLGKWLNKLSVNKIPPSEYVDLQIQFLNKSEIYNESWSKDETALKPEREDFKLDIERSAFYFMSDSYNSVICEGMGIHPPSEIKGSKPVVIRWHLVHRPLVSNIAHWQLEVQVIDLNMQQDITAQIGQKSKLMEKLASTILKSWLLKGNAKWCLFGKIDF